MSETVFREFPSDEIKLIPSPVPAHWRYWTFVGLAAELGAGNTRVQVYGVAAPGFSCPVGVRAS